MTDKVQKIKDWISCQQDSLIDANGNFQHSEDEAVYHTLCNLDAYIDYLQEVPIFKVGDIIQKKDNNSIRYSIINKTSDGYRALRGLSDTIVIWFSEQDQWELVKEPVNEDLEEAAHKYADGENPTCSCEECLIRTFKVGAKWQEKKDKEITETAIHHAYHNGRLEMKEQMLTKAIDAHCFGFQGAALFSFRLPSGNYLVGSEVKVIVIKED